MNGQALALAGAGGPPPAGHRRISGGSGWAVAAAGVLVAFLATVLLADALSPVPSGPASSSYATTSTGVAAWAELLARAGHPVSQLRQDLGSAALDPSSTLVVLGAMSLTPAAAHNIERFVRSGGRLVISTAVPGRVLPALITEPPDWVRVSPRLYEPVGASLPRSGVASAGAGAWVGGAGRRALEDRTGGALLLVDQLGRGTIDLLADPSPVQNRLLAAAGNAQFAIDLAGPVGRPVVFAEALHGFGAATGIAALPLTFWIVFVGLCLAGGTWALARGWRLGPPEQPAELGPPPRSAYVEAMAGVLTRAGDAVGLTGQVRGRIEAELERRVARRAAGPGPSRREALRSLGLSEGETDLVLAPAPAPASAGEGETELVALGRLLARLRSER